MESMSQEFYDEYNLENVKKLFLFNDNDLLRQTNHKDYTEEENTKYIKKIRKSLYNIIIENKSKKKINYIVKSCNRLYSSDGKSLQYYSNKLLKHILPNNCYEVDIKNCNPKILLYLCKKHNLNHKNLQEYCDNRNELLKKSKLSKTFVLKEFNKDNPKKHKVKWLNDLLNELNQNKQIILEKEGDVINSQYKNDKKDSYNPISSLVCSIIWYYENKILLKATKLCNCIIPKFDGITTNTENLDLNEFNKLSEEFMIEWDIKPFNSDVDLNHIELDNDLLNKKLNEYFYKDFHIKSAKNAYTLAQDTFKYLQASIKYCNDKWLVLDNSNLWIETKEPIGYIYKIVRIGLNNQNKYLQKQYNEAVESEDEDNIEKYKLHSQENLKDFDRIDKSSFCSQYKKYLMKELKDDNFLKDKLDNNPYTIAYKNGIYNIITKEFQSGIFPHNYLSKTLDFDYNQHINQNDIKFLKDELLKIMNCDFNHLEYLLSVLGYSFSNDASKYQHFYFCIGQLAGNGKSAIFESLEKSFPQYVGCIDSQLLETDYTKKHKLITKLQHFRLIYLNEMKDGKKICSKTVKLISDGSIVSNEVMYGTEENINIKCKAFLLSNPMADFDKLDKGSYRRYKHIQWDSEFRPEYKEDDYENKKFVADLNFPTKLYEKREALLSIILDYANKVYYNGLPEMPDEFENEKELVKDTNMEINDYLDNILDITNDDNDKVSKDELIDKYRNDKNKQLNSKTLMDIMKQLGHSHKYNKAIMKKGCRGCYVGMKIIKEPSNEDDVISSDDD